MGWPVAKLNDWNNCACCKQRYKVTEPNFQDNCSVCFIFKVKLNPMDWRLFQKQRAVLLALTTDERMSEGECEALEGLLALTDTIVDAGKEHGYQIPSLDEVLLDRMADL